MYTVSADPARKLIVLKIVGMMTEDEVTRFYRDEHAAIRSIDCRPGEHCALVDLTECNLQLQEVAAAFQKRIGGHGKAKRLAMFTGPSPARMQARRILQRADAAIFTTRQEAEAWLFAEGEAQAAA